MKKVFYVLKDQVQTYFIEQENAEIFAETEGGEIFQEEYSEKQFKTCLKQSNYFYDQPQNGNGTTPEPEPENPEELKQKLEQLQKENEQLKRFTTLSFEEAARIYSRKAKLLQDVSKFEKVLKSLGEVELKQTDDSINTDSAELVLLTGNYTKTERFRINNVHIISDFIEFTTLKVNNKIELLKAEVQEM